MMFMLQIYAPLDSKENPSTFHRTLFLFCCRDGRCAGKNGSVKCFRTQLPRANPFYSYDPPDYDRPELEPDIKMKQCSFSTRNAETLEKIIELKAEGNRLFTEKCYSQAIEVYGNAISIAHTDKSETNDDRSAELGHAEVAKVPLGAHPYLCSS